MSNLVVLVLAFCFGFLLGYVKPHFSNEKRNYDGLFILDDSDDSKTRWILDMKMDPDEIKNKKEIHLKVYEMDNVEVKQGDV